MVRHAPIHRRAGHSDIAICCGRNVRGSSPSTSVVPPLESGHHFESQMTQRIQNVFGRTLSQDLRALLFLKTFGLYSCVIEDDKSGPEETSAKSRNRSHWLA